MAVESTEQIEQLPVERWRFTVDDFQRMGEIGIFGPEPRAELIDGEIYPMNPIGPAHSGRVMRLNATFTASCASLDGSVKLGACERTPRICGNGWWGRWRSGRRVTR